MIVNCLIIFQLAEDGGLDWDALVCAVKPQTRCALIQRSRGYSWRQSLSVNKIERAIKMIKVSLQMCNTNNLNCIILGVCL